MAGDTTEHGPVRAVVGRLDELTDEDRLDIEMIVVAFGPTAFLPVLMVLALIVVSPLSGIPFLPTFIGLMIAMVAAQMIVRRKQIWLPRLLLRRRVSGQMLHRALRRSEGAAAWLDRRVGRRLGLLVSPPLDTLPKACCLVSGLSMPLLELVPFSSSLLGLAILLFSTGLLTRDGLFAILGAGIMGCAAMVPVAVYGGLLIAAQAG